MAPRDVSAISATTPSWLASTSPSTARSSPQPLDRDPDGEHADQSVHDALGHPSEPSRRYHRRMPVRELRNVPGQALSGVRRARQHCPRSPTRPQPSPTLRRWPGQRPRTRTAMCPRMSLPAQLVSQVIALGSEPGRASGRRSVVPAGHGRAGPPVHRCEMRRPRCPGCRDASRTEHRLAVSMTAARRSSSKAS